jgi:hypothetical protein
LLFDFGTAALGAFDVALIVFGDCQGDRELFVTGLAKVFVMRH